MISAIRVISLVLFLVLSYGCVSRSHVEMVRVSERGARLRSPRLEVLFEDGRLVECRHLKGNVMFSELGNDSGTLEYGVKIGETGGYRHPDRRSVFNARELEDGWQLSWRGLGDGSDFSSDAEFSVLVSTDSSGALVLSMSSNVASSGYHLPLVNISPASRLVMPHRGGVAICHGKVDFTERYMKGPDCEAPVFAIEREYKSLGMWVEAAEDIAYTSVLRDGRWGMGFGFELPAKSFELKLDGFAGDWRMAMAPYRRWYRAAHGESMDLRDKYEGPESLIQVVADRGGTTPNLSELLPSKIVLWYDFGSGVLPAKTSRDGASAYAHGLRWVLYELASGMEKSRIWGGLHGYLPVSGYLFGTRAWIPTFGADDDASMHAIASASDSLGGLGMVNGEYDRVGTGEMGAHLTERAILFANKNLVPVHPMRTLKGDAICLYQGIDGTYTYCDDGLVQTMFGPNGHEIYARLHGVKNYHGTLHLPGWPLQDNWGLFGLNPEVHYALTPIEDEQPPSLRVVSLPPSVRLERYLEQGGFAYLEFVSDEGTQEVEFKVEVPMAYRELWLNGVRQERSSDGRYRGHLPLSFLALRNPASPPTYGYELGHSETKAYRLMRSGIYAHSGGVRVGDLGEVRAAGKQDVYCLGGRGRRCFDFAIRVPSNPSEMRVWYRDFGESVGDGILLSITVNGVEKHRFESCVEAPVPSSRPLRFERKYDHEEKLAVIDFTEYAGQGVVLSLIVDSKKDTLGDRFHIGFPWLVRLREKTE